LAEGVDSRILAGDASPGQERIQSISRTPEEQRQRRRLVRRFLHKNRSPLSTTHFSLDLMGIPVADHPRVQAADVIHLHWAADSLSSASLGELAELGKPCVWTLHDMRPLTGGCHFPAGCRKCEQGCGSCPQLWRDHFQTTARTVGAMEGALRALRPHWVAPSVWMSVQVRTSRLGRGGEVSVIPYGVDSVLFCPGSRQEARRELNLPEQGKLILLASHSLVEKRKGFEEARRVLCRFREEEKKNAHGGSGEPAPALVVAGRDLEDLRLPGWMVHRVGYLQPDRMPLLYRAVDVLLFTATEDNFPNVVLEAMASGLPVVGHRVGGVEDQLGGEKPCGVLFSLEEPLAGVRGLQRVLAREAFAEDLARLGGERIATNYTLSRKSRAGAGLFKK